MEIASYAGFDPQHNNKADWSIAELKVALYNSRKYSIKIGVRNGRGNMRSIHRGETLYLHTSVVAMKYFYLSACLLVATIQTSARTGTYSPLSPYERQIVASVLILEAASDGTEGMRAILNVIYNRADRDVYRVVRAAVRKGSFYSMHSIWGRQKPDYGPILRRAQQDPHYANAVKLVMVLERGALLDTTNGATHYYLSSDQPPYWVAQMHFRVTIGSHHFFARYPLTMVKADMPVPANP